MGENEDVAIASSSEEERVCVLRVEKVCAIATEREISAALYQGGGGWTVVGQTGF